MTNELTSKGVRRGSIARYPAIDGRNLGKVELRENVTLLSRLFCTRGTIGCYLSHRNVWMKICQEQHPYQVVCEDDILVSDNFMDRIKTIMSELQNNDETRDDWDVLLLGAFGAVHPDRKHGVFHLLAFAGGRTRKARRVSQHVHVPHRPFGAHCYILSKRGAAKLARSAYIANGHLDVTAWGLKRLNLFCVDPLLAYQDMSSPSTIGAVTKGVETRIPQMTIDKYTNITLEWALNEPLIILPGFNALVTIGRSLIWAVGGIILGVALVVRGALTCFLLNHISLIGLVMWLLRALHEPVG